MALIGFDSIFIVLIVLDRSIFSLFTLAVSDLSNHSASRTFSASSIWSVVDDVTPEFIMLILVIFESFNKFFFPVYALTSPILCKVTFVESQVANSDR